MAILVATLIDQAQALADKRGDASIPGTDWLTYVNWAVKALYRLIVAADPGAYFEEANFTLTATPGNSFVDLSSIFTPDPAALHGLDKYPDTNRRRTVTSRTFRERNRGVVGSWVPAAYAEDIKYDLRGRKLYVTPYENAAGPYRAYARLAPYLFTGVSDPTELDWQLEPYDEFIVIMAARKGLGIEESETGLQSERLAELREEITAEHTRDDGEPIKIADVEDDGAWDV